MFAVFKESARQKNARDRFELFMKVLAAFRRKRRASKDARLIFLQTNFSRNRVYIEDNLIRRLASNNDSPYHSIFLFLNRYHLFSFNSKRVNTRIISSKRKLKKEGPEF